MSDQVVSFGPESFKILSDGTVVVESEKLKDLIRGVQNQTLSFEVLDAWLEVSPVAS